MFARTEWTLIFFRIQNFAVKEALIADETNFAVSRYERMANLEFPRRLLAINIQRYPIASRCAAALDAAASRFSLFRPHYRALRSDGVVRCRS